MKPTRTQNLLAAALVCALAFTATVAQAALAAEALAAVADPSTSLDSARDRSLGAGPLPSWNDGKAKQSIVDFVSKVTKEGSPDFVPPAERIAVFDNDGTPDPYTPSK